MSDIAAVEILQVNCAGYNSDAAQLLNKIGNTQGWTFNGQNVGLWPAMSG